MTPTPRTSTTTSPRLPPQHCGRRPPNKRINTEIDRLAIEDLKARLAELEDLARIRRVARELARTNRRLARAAHASRGSGRIRRGQP